MSAEIPIQIEKVGLESSSTKAMAKSSIEVQLLPLVGMREALQHHDEQCISTASSIARLAPSDRPVPSVPRANCRRMDRLSESASRHCSHLPQSEAKKERGHQSRRVHRQRDRPTEPMRSWVECQHQGRGGLGCCGFGPKALAVSRWGRFVRESSRWRASSLTACSL